MHEQSPRFDRGQTSASHKGFVAGWFDLLFLNTQAEGSTPSPRQTIEGVAADRSENHIRAILDLPLGDTTANGFAAMVNFIGDIPPVEDVLKIPGAHYHSYGKEPRPGRKLGHATLTSQSRAELMTRLKHVLKLNSM